jgi:hypothetical protein
MPMTRRPGRARRCAPRPRRRRATRRWARRRTRWRCRSSRSSPASAARRRRRCGRARDAHDLEPAPASVGGRRIAHQRRGPRGSDRRSRALPSRPRRPGATKRATVSTWPSVWSLSRPSPSQMTARRRGTRAAAPRSPCVHRGAVAVGVEQALARGQHVPSPSTSTAPPSSTNPARNARTGPGQRGDAPATSASWAARTCRPSR